MRGDSPVVAHAGEAGSCTPSAPVSPDDFTGIERGLVAPVSFIENWLAIAQPGDRFTYAVRTSLLPAGSPGAAWMRLLREQGLVELFQKRSDTIEGATCYVARRTTRTIADARAPAPRRERISLPKPTLAHEEAAAIDKLLPILQRDARFCRPCRTDAQLAKQTGLTREDVEATFDAMRAANLIRVQGCAAPTLRLVTIVATGHRTGFVG